MYDFARRAFAVMVRGMNAPATPLPLAEADIDAAVTAALAEDVGSGDVTSQAVLPEDLFLTAAIVAREPLVVAGMPLAMAVFSRLDPLCRFDMLVADGSEAEAGALLAYVHGRARAVLAGERAALNFLQHLSGIASATRRYVAAVAGTGVVILDTRKTIPGLRQLAKYAVRMGGGQNHRQGLYDAVLIKDNHIALAGGITAAVKGSWAAGFAEIEVECDTIDQVMEALSLGVEHILLDNMPPHVLRQAVALGGGRARFEASGGVRLETVREIAEAGVDYISVGRLTSSSEAVDIGLDIEGDINSFESLSASI